MHTRKQAVVPARFDRERRAAIKAYVQFRGVAAAIERASMIAALPAVTWKGRTLRTIRCRGTRGKGPHDVNVPEALLWALIDPRDYRCPYHDGD